MKEDKHILAARPDARRRTGPNEQRRAETRAALVAAARRAFADIGFAAASTEAIVRDAQVTRGALYHHFADKEDLFAAVFEDVSQSVVRRIALAAGRHTDPWDGFVAGHDAFLDACLNAEVRRVLVIDGVAVLGTHRWRELDLRFTAGSLLHGLRAVQFAGYLTGHDPEMLAALLSGAINDAAIVIDQADDPAAARAAVGAELHRLLVALKAGAGSSSSPNRQRKQLGGSAGKPGGKRGNRG